MTTIWAIVYSSLRGYRTFRGRRKSSWDSVFGEKLQTQMFPENASKVNDHEEYDLDSYESNFAAIGEFHKIHEKEISIQKEKTHTCIIKQKYFANKEPVLLTWDEMEKIRLLHTEDPIKWSLDRLSESFPASRETINKILHSKWSPKSVKVIQNHDEQVQNNWKLFRAERLAVDSKLHAHLINFKNRNIRIRDAEIMEKMIKAKPVFASPTSNMFSSIIQGYVNHNPSDKNCKQIKKLCNQSTKNLRRQFPFEILDNKTISSGKYSQEAFTYEIFLEKYAESVNANEITLVDRVIVDENKQQNAEAYKSKSLVLESKSIMGNFNLSELIEEKTDNILLTESVKQETFQTMVSVMNNENTMETGVIARQKKVTKTPDDYPEFIKISDQNYKLKAVYRIQDRYYDNDGEFLYRVPGILS